MITGDLPKVSIVTPSFNQAQFIEETILSVQRQKYPNVEHIVIDGGSVDGTLDILKKFGDKISWISEPDRGQADAVNKGIRKASGEFIGWLNSDDIYFNDTIYFAVKAFQDRPDVDVVYGDLFYIDQDGKILMERKEINFDFDILLYGLCYIGQQSTFYKKNIFEDIGYLDVNLQYVMDWELFLRIAVHGKKYLLVPDVKAGFRLHSESKSIGQQIKLRSEHKIIRDKYWRKKRFKNKAITEIYSKCNEYYYRTKRKWRQLKERRYIIPPGTSELIFKKANIR